jgi:hypothetical protein
MHLVHAGLTTSNTGSQKKKLSVKEQRAKDQHDVWLKKQGLHPNQMALRKKKQPTTLKLNFATGQNELECSNGFANGGFKKSVFDSEWNKQYDDDAAMAERETEALKKAESLKGRIAPLYNKGPLQLATAGHNAKDGNGRGKT